MVYLARFGLYLKGKSLKRSDNDSEKVHLSTLLLFLCCRKSYFMYICVVPIFIVRTLLVPYQLNIRNLQTLSFDFKTKKIDELSTSFLQRCPTYFEVHNLTLNANFHFNLCVRILLLSDASKR